MASNKRLLVEKNSSNLSSKVLTERSIRSIRTPRIPDCLCHIPQMLRHIIMVLECRCSEDLEALKWEGIIRKWLVVPNKYRSFQGTLTDICTVCHSHHLK